MKRLLVFLCVSALVFAVATPLLAGGIDNKHNFSAEYARTLNRNAATDSADAVVYNPAGTVKMEDGLYVNLAGQYAFKDYSNTFNGTEYDSDEPDIVPSLFALYRKDRWAGFAAFTIPAGGGSVDYEDGMATTYRVAQGVIATGAYAAGSIRDMGLEGEMYYYGITVGGACALNDWLSVSVGLRYVDANREFEGFATMTPIAPVPETLYVEYEETGHGWGGIFGMNISPTDELNIGIRAETKTHLTLETDQKRDDVETVLGGDLVPDNAKRNRDFPALFGFGVSYQLTSNLRTEANFTYYLANDADWDDDPITTGDETQKDDGFDIGIALEYAFTPKFKASLGYMYTETEMDADDMLAAAPELDAQSVAAGLAYEVMPGLHVNVGVIQTFYDEETTTPNAVFPTGIELEKEVTLVALGIQYKFW
ncbi:MAG: outer membrane protein transport protein [Desulfobacterales bacterium]|nr:MAG: outer membrane protein transport protein [Desulfobacterales bacterium]